MKRGGDVPGEYVNRKEYMKRVGVLPSEFKVCPNISSGANKNIEGSSGIGFSGNENTESQEERRPRVARR